MLRNTNKLNALRNLFYVAVLSFTISCVKAEYLSIDPKNPMSLISSYLMSLLKVTGLASSSDTTLSLTMISAILYDENGSPLANARMDINSTSSIFLSRAFTTVYTDSDGMYEISTGDGTLSISVTKSDGTSMGSFSIKVEGEKTPAVTNNNSSFQSSEPQAVKRPLEGVAVSTLQSIAFSSTELNYPLGVFIQPIIPRITGGRPTSCTISPSLPNGLSLKQNSCTIAGTPLQASSKTLYTITAVGNGSVTTTLSLTFLQPDPPLNISFASSPYTYQKGQVVNIQPTYTGGKIKQCSVFPFLKNLGLFLDPFSCKIGGIANSILSITQFTVTIQNAGGSITGNFELGINANPAYLSPGIVYTGSPFIFTQGEAIQTITPNSLGGTIQTCSINPSLPAGITLNPSNCSISGTPTVQKSSMLYSITAGNGNGNSTTIIGITVNAGLQKPNISYIGAYTLTAGLAPQNPILPNNLGGAISGCSVTPELPVGLSFNSSNCSITGTPMAVTAISGYTVTALNQAGSSPSTVLILSILSNIPKPSISFSGSPFVLTQNAPLTTSNPINTGGSTTSCVITPTLPSGMSFNTTNCAISGTPTTIQTTTPYAVTATNQAGTSDPAVISITINPAVQKPTLNFVGSPYTFTQNALVNAISPQNSGGNIATCNINPNPPAGMGFDTLTCSLYGTPTVTQSASNYTVIATNLGGSDTKMIAITINLKAPEALSYFGSPFVFTKAIAISSKTPTYTGTIASCAITPPLPSGLNFNTSTCVISGTPTVIQSATSYTITASNNGGSVITGIVLNVINNTNLTVSMPSGLLKTGQTIVYQAGDDGTYQKGVARNFVAGGTTGMIWQRCSAGQNNDANCSGTAQSYTWDQANSYCSSLSLDGRSWRLPTVNELSNLIEYGKSISPTITTNIFSNTPSDGSSYYWSSTIATSLSVQKVYHIAFFDGYQNYVLKTNQYYTRCISNNGNNLIPKIDNQDGIISDIDSGLIWQKCTVGQNFDNCIGIGSKYTWQNAIIQCENLNLGGRSDWRLPNINELKSIISYNKSSNPTIDSTIFPNSYSDTYWSSTSISSNPNINGWGVYFLNGVVSAGPKTNSYYLRCVTDSSNSNLAPKNLSYPNNSLNLTVGTPINPLTPSVTGTVTTYSVSPSLPSGLILNATTGVISGTPSSSLNTTTYIISASNSVGYSYFQISISIINPGIVSIPNGLLKTGQTVSYLTGDDGNYQKGVSRNYVAGGTSGLIWQRCNAGQVGSNCSGDGNNLLLDQAINYCNNLNLDGRVWRLPTVNELSNLVDYGVESDTTIDSIAFPNIHPTIASHWTSSLYGQDKSKAWYVHFFNGAVNYVSKFGSGYFAKCISGQLENNSSYQDLGNSTVIDAITGLVWQKCSVGQSLISCSGTATTYSWEGAVGYCNNLSLGGRSNWRLPNINELRSMIEYNSTSYPTLNISLFPNTKIGSYWSSTTYVIGTSSAWILSFVNGSIDYGSKINSNNYYVRCVAGP